MRSTVIVDQLVHQPLLVLVVEDMMNKIGDQFLPSLILLDLCFVVHLEIYDRLCVPT